MKKVAVAVSGGVDSATTAYLLKSQGYDCFGVTMVLFENPSFLEDAKKVCEQVGIPHHVIDLSSEFKEEVINYFISEYEKGRTPNPCVKCNRLIKFGRFIEEAFKLGADFFATGHYVKKIDDAIYISDNMAKDQSYFLGQIKKEFLPKIMFPLYEKDKSETRSIAKESGLSVHDKKDSQEVCFISTDYKDFLSKYIDMNISGNIKDSKGNIIKKHNGIYTFTIGQRKGMGIASPEPLYVLSINPKTGDVVVGSNEELYTKELICYDINLLTEESLDALVGQELFAKIRSRDTLHAVKIEKISENRVKLLFAEGVRAITPGQIAALYTAEHRLLASGWIE